MSLVFGGLDDDRLIFERDDLADDTADGRDLVTDLHVIAHFLRFLLLLSLRTNHQEVERNDGEYEQTDGQPALRAACQQRKGGKLHFSFLVS